MTHSRTLGALALAGLLAACGEDGFAPASLFAGGGGGAGDEAGATTTIEQRDVEAPEVFQVSEAAVWDGRPSLGGIWVAHPEVQEPERVIIRDEASGNFVVGALFRRERTGAGPRLQVSSEAAEALSLTAGIPTTLEVTALRQEDVPVTAPAAAEGTLDAVTPIETTPLENPTEEELATIARAGIEAEAPAGDGPPPSDVISAPIGASVAAPVESGADVPASVPTPVSTPDAVAPSRPFVQVGIFGEPANARRAQAALEGAGLPAITREESLGGRTFYRVVAGPAPSSQERERYLAQARSLGYPDAYAVQN